MGTQRQKSSRVLVAGDSCIDIYRFGSCNRKSPEAPVSIYDAIGESVDERPGMGTNVANNLRVLGLEVTECMPPSLITKTRFVDVSNNHHIMRVDVDVPIREIGEEDIQNVNWSGLDALVIADYCKGAVTERAARWLVSRAHRSGVPVFVDTKKHTLMPFGGCVVKMNEHERVFVRDECIPELDLIVTRGSAGVRWNDKAFAPHRVEQVYDVCGAGDVFMAGLVAAYLRWAVPGQITREDALERAIRFGNHAAALSVRHFGTHVLNAPDLMDLSEVWGA